MTESYHIDHFGPCEPHWPKGGWAIYRISGDEIADRVVRERVNPLGFYEGDVIARHSWCGYLGIRETLEEVLEVIKTASSV